MDEWKEYNIGNILLLEYGKTLKDYRKGYGKYDVFGTNGKIGLTDNFLYNEPSIIIGRKGAYREVHFAKSPFFVIDTAFYTKKRTNETDTLFMYYWFKNIDINAMDSGSAIPSTSRDEVYELPISLPSLSEQKSIAEALGGLDDKIDLLQRQNRTLEQLAETLFRQWFVEEENESWEVVKLGDVSVIQNGYAFSSKDYVPFQEGLLEVFKMGHIEKGGGLRTNPKKDFVPREEKLERWILNKKDIVMAMTDMKDNVVILGVPAMIDQSNKYVLNQRVARIYLPSNKKILNSYILYIQLNNKDFIATLQSKANSGVQVNLSTEAIRDCDIKIPPLDFQRQKGILITNLYLKKENNEKQIKTLSKLRDTLLPKFMNGYLRFT